MFVARSQKVRGEKYKIVQKRKGKRERGKREREKGRENYGNALLFRDNSIEFAHTRNTKPEEIIRRVMEKEWPIAKSCVLMMTRSQESASLIFALANTIIASRCERRGRWRSERGDRFISRDCIHFGGWILSKENFHRFGENSLWAFWQARVIAIYFGANVTYASRTRNVYFKEYRQFVSLHEAPFVKIHIRITYGEGNHSFIRKNFENFSLEEPI